MRSSWREKRLAVALVEEHVERMVPFAEDVDPLRIVLLGVHAPASGRVVLGGRGKGGDAEGYTSDERAFPGAQPAEIVSQVGVGVVPVDGLGQQALLPPLLDVLRATCSMPGSATSCQPMRQVAYGAGEPSRGSRPPAEARAQRSDSQRPARSQAWEVAAHPGARSQASM